MKRQLLEYSYKRGLGHIPSALSMVDYLDVLFTEKVVTPESVFVIGKPFGAQAYYILWREYGWLDDIDNLSIGVKHDEIPFVDFSEETMGNALGVAAGIALTTDRRVWVNISDAALQMGNTLEALQFIGHHKLNNVYVTVDYNDAQCTGKTSDVLNVRPVMAMAEMYGWDVRYIDGHDKQGMKEKLRWKSWRPTLVICKTVKGHGIPSIESDITKWHYKKIETLNELQSLVAELPDT